MSEVLLTVNGETHNYRDWSRITGIHEKTIVGRVKAGWDMKDIFNPPGKWQPKAKFNEHYFDIIDDEHKAYWIGFIWCDGYMAIRNRNNRSTSYEFKLSLKEDDYRHLEKFNKDIDGKYEVKYYDCPTSWKDGAKEARLLITNQYFGKTLVYEYGLIPNRIDCSKLIEHIPEHLVKHFIRGILDADGSFSHYECLESWNGYEYVTQKCVVDIGGHTEILKFIESHLIQNGVINNFDRKIQKRHEEDDRDGEYRNIKFSGRNQAMKLLHYVYDDATIYLDRKYEKFLSIVEKLEGSNEVQTI